MYILEFTEENFNEIAKLMDNGTDLEQFEEMLSSHSYKDNPHMFISVRDEWMFVSEEVIEGLLYAAIKLKED